MIKYYLLPGIFMLVASAIFAQNYDEAKVAAYTLPDPLRTLNSRMITSKQEWEKVRRPEILSLFEKHVYGTSPEKYDSIQYIRNDENKEAMEGKAWMKKLQIIVYRGGKSVAINLVLFIPTKPRKPVPAFLLINNRGLDIMDVTREKKSEFWPVETVIESGYAIAAFQVNDAAPDNKDTYMNGVLQLYPELLVNDTGMKAIGSWAWAASRAMDYLETDKRIDSRRVTVVGHSRGGKASLWAGAQDQRFNMVISNCSGNTGAAIARRQFGETIKRINNSFPHWFADSYKKYNDNVEALPVDQHMLVALIAPRPIYVTNASKDLWADPKGTFLSLKHAEKVYALYNIKSSLPSEAPAINTPISNSQLAYHNREGEHNMTLYDWKNFIHFANYHYQR